MSQIRIFSLALATVAGGLYVSNGKLVIKSDGDVLDFDLGPATEVEAGDGDGQTRRGSVIFGPQSVSFNGDLWRLIESSGLVEDFVKLCLLSRNRAETFVSIVQAALEEHLFVPRFFETIVTVDHTLSAPIYSATDDEGKILSSARNSNDFEINEGNEVEMYLGAGREDIQEIELQTLLNKLLLRAKSDWKQAFLDGLLNENAYLRSLATRLLRDVNSDPDLYGEAKAYLG